MIRRNLLLLITVFHNNKKSADNNLNLYSDYGKKTRLENDMFDIDLELFPIHPLVPQIGDVLQLAGSIASFYKPPIYAYCMFDFSTILHAAKNCHQFELLENPNKLLLSPQILINRGYCALGETMGLERSKHLEKVMEVLWNEHEKSSFSLSRECARHDIGNLQLINFLRGLTLCSAIGHPFMHQAVYILDALLNYGEVDEHLMLPGDGLDRVVILSRLCMSVAKEFGNYSMLLLALTLLNRASLEVNYSTCKQIAACFHRIEHRLLDWRVKSCGKLTKKSILDLKKTNKQIKTTKYNN